MMKNAILRFSRKDAGAVTVDWVVLTAAVVVIAAGALVSITQETLKLSETVGAEIPLKVQK